MNIKGGVINTGRAQGAVGGDVNIESLQDTATYDSKQKNMGFNADIDIAGAGAGSSLSVNGGKTNLNADYKAVGEQSGIFAHEADLVVEGKGRFIGGVFVTSEEAQANGKSNIVFKQGIEAEDIQNTSSYDGDAISVGVSLGNTDGKPQANMNGIGYGADSDSNSSITKGGVSGYNDEVRLFTTENRDALAGKLDDVFDANRVNKELGAQTQITQEFGKEAPKAVAEFSQSRINAIRANPNLSADEKMAAISKWDEGGIYRVAAHTALGALGTGSVEGALTTGGVAAAAPTINNLEVKMRDMLIAQGMDADTASNATKGITSLALAGAGVAAGLDTSSTVTAVNVDANNRQLHWSEMQKLNESAKDLASKYGRGVEYWKSLLYAVTYAELDKKGNDRLATFKKDFAKPAYSQNAQAFEKIIENDIAIAQKSYSTLKAKYGNVELEKDRNTSVSQNKPIHMFDDSGYYNENSIYGTYGGSYQGNRNNQKDFNKVAKNINNQMSDIATRDDRIEPLYPEQYYIPLSELKAIRAAGISAAKLVAQKEAREQLLENLKGLSVNNNLKYHLANADGFTRAKGISGGHNRTNFEAELKKQGGRVASETPTGVDGIVTVKYKIPKFDRAGNRDGWKSIKDPKTIYDPTKFSDSKMLDMGIEAAVQKYNAEFIKLGKTSYSSSINGVSFRVYIDPETGAITNVHPR